MHKNILNPTFQLTVLLLHRGSLCCPRDSDVGPSSCVNFFCTAEAGRRLEHILQERYLTTEDGF